MGIRDILVHLDNSDSCAARLDVAIAYASKHGACLRGLYVITHHFYEPRGLREKVDCDKVEAMFTSKTTEAGVTAEWVFQDCTVMGSTLSDLITVHAYFTDLIIIGQTDRSAPVINIPADLAERVSLMSGRPVLVVPYTGTFKSAGTRVMIAWKMGREAIRALNDSLPHLHKAHTITIAEIETTATNRNSSLDKVCAFLVKHSIHATTELISAGSFPVGDMILNNVCEKNIDLLVMGAFAQNRREKLDLSPIAAHILKHLTVPVLISH